MERFTAELECGVPSRQKRNYEELKELTEGVNSLDVRTGKPSFICLECVGYNKEPEEQQDESSLTAEQGLEEIVLQLQEEVHALRERRRKLQEVNAATRRSVKVAREDPIKAAVDELIEEAQALRSKKKEALTKEAEQKEEPKEQADVSQLVWQANSLISSLRLFKLLDTAKLKQSDDEFKEEFRESFLFINDEGKELRRKLLRSIADGFTSQSLSQALKTAFQEFDSLFRSFEKETEDKWKWFDLTN